jgi:hypothetical protein
LTRLLALLFVCLTFGAPALAAGSLEKLVHEKTFGPWTVTVLKDGIFNRNNCRLTAESSAEVAGGTATMRVELLIRAQSTKWETAIFLPQLGDEGEIVLSVDATMKRELRSQHISSSTAYLSADFTHLLLKDFATGELLGENITISYQSPDGTNRTAHFTLDDFSDARRDLEHSCATL